MTARRTTQSRTLICLRSFFPIFTLILTACGDDGKTSGTGGAEATLTPDQGVHSPVACDAASCPSTEYCFDAFNGEHQIVFSACRAIPAECKDDEQCLKQDAVKAYRAEKYCTGANVTAQHLSPGIYKVSCTKY